MTTIDETNPHYKFAKYWEVIGRPELEVYESLSNVWHIPCNKHVPANLIFAFSKRCFLPFHQSVLSYC